MKRVVNYLLSVTTCLLLMAYPSTTKAVGFSAASPDEEDEASQALVVWMKDGSKARFALDTNLRTTFYPDTRRIRIQYSLYGGNNYYWLEMANVLRYTYEGIATSVPTLKALPEQMLVNFTDNGLTISRLPEGAMVQVYTSDGRMVTQQRASGTSAIMISFMNYPSGVYIVKAPNQTFKFIKR